MFLLTKAPTEKWFWYVAGLHLVVWSVLPFILNSNPPLDIVESIVWGREWELGYAKHPPLAIWLTEIAYIISGNSVFGVYLLSQLSVVLAMYCVWRLAREFLDKNKALLSALILDCVYYYNYTSPEFNPNVLQLSLWAICALFFFRSVTYNKSSDWLLLGVFAGAALITKYFSAIFLFVLLLLLIFTKQGRGRLTSFGPYVTFLVVCAVISPHIYWLFESNFLTIDYASHRSSNLESIAGHIIYPIRFIFSQFLALAFALLLVLLVFDRRYISLPKSNHSFKSLFPWVIALGPFVILLLLSAIFGIRLRSMWGMPLWSFVGIIFFLSYNSPITSKLLLKFKKIWAVIFCLAAFVYIVVHGVAPGFGFMSPGNYPGTKIAKVFTDKWHDKYGVKLKYIGGLIQVVGNISFYSEDKPKIITNMKLQNNPWAKRSEVYKYGALVVWDLKKQRRPIPKEWIRAFPGTQIQTGKVTIGVYKDNIKPLEFIWAVIPPGTKQKDEK